MKNSKMHKHIDKLLFEGKEAEAAPLIEAVWAKEEAQEKKEIADFNRRLDALEKLQQSKRNS